MKLSVLLEEYKQDLLVSAACGVLTYGGLEGVAEITGKHFGVLTHMACEFPIAVITFITLTHRARSHSTLSQLTQETPLLHETMRDVLTSALHSQRSAENFHAIQSGHQYDPGTSEIIRDLVAAQNGANLLEVIEKTSVQMRQRVDEDLQWRVILQR